MQIEILGTAAGGGFPQWNCACRNCDAVRRGSFAGKPRTQLQVAMTSDGHAWFLLNASPDLRNQIESSPFLQPHGGVRNSPISGVVLSSADLDQALGLLLLRELQPLQVFATNSVRSILLNDNSMFSMLHRIPDQAHWNEVAPGVVFKLSSRSGDPSEIECLPIALAGRYPSYVTSARAKELAPNEGTLGLVVKAESGRRFGYFPVVGHLNERLLHLFNSLDLLLFDGTFWTDDELIRLQNHAHTARQMGHIPVGSEAGSLALLSNLRCPRKIFVHINNTNPMLDESSPEYRQAREAGWEIVEDGCHLEL